MTLEQSIEETKKIIANLKALRGTHDQTMRTGVIKELHGTKKIKGVTPTARFLEDRIAYLEGVLHTAHVDLLDEE